MSPRASDAPGVAGAVVRVNGAETDPALADKLIDVAVDRRTGVPDRTTLRYRDFDLAILDGGPFSIGASLQVALGASESAEFATVFDGQIVALEPEFDERGATAVVCALDRSHLLQRAPRTNSYQQMSYGEIASQIAQRAGLQPSSVSPGLRPDFVQQSNETDWDFLRRLALEVDYNLAVSARELEFAPAQKAAAQVTPLVWGDTLFAFHPRVSGVGQLSEVAVRGWDPKTANAIEATATPPTPAESIGVAREDVVGALGGGKMTVADRPVCSSDHAATLASGMAARMAESFVEGEGSAEGSPNLVPGGRVSIEGVGSTFSGTYALTGVRHLYRAVGGYTTDFSIAGGSDRTVFGLTRPTDAPGWRRRVVVGVVTNNSDPEKLGRVRVKYPALDETHEGWWARVVAPGSGASRGLFSLPQVGDEVLVVFEHEDDSHPYLLGSVFNGTKTPGTVVESDGSFMLATPHHVTIQATEKAGITTGDTFTCTSSKTAKITTRPAQSTGGDSGGAGGSEGAAPPGDIVLDSKGALTLEGDGAATVSAGTKGSVSAKTGLTLSGGTQVTVEADGSVTIEGASLTISAKGTLTLSAPQIMLG